MELTEYFELWVAYRKSTDPDYNWVDGFDTRKQAMNYVNEHFKDGKVRCCLSVDAQLCGDEFAYGDTKAEALKNLKKQLRPHDLKPYDPFKE